MSAWCSHGVLIERACIRCQDEAIDRVEAAAVLHQLKPLARRKSGTQKCTSVPLELLERVLAIAERASK